MQYIHVALALHSAGKKVTADNIKKMLSSVGADADDSQIKALVTVLSDVNIDEAVKSAPVGMVSAAPAAGGAAPAASAPAAVKEPEKSGDDMGLDSLFG